MNWLALLKALIVAVSAFTGWLDRRALLAAGRAEAVSEYLKRAIDDIEAAKRARETMAGDLVRNPERLRDDDGFKRPD